MHFADSPAPRRISIFDTTLRDGEQAPGNALDPERKLDLAMRIEELGVDVIEAGFPASSPSDYRAAQLISKSLTRAEVATFCRANRRDIDLAVEAVGIENHQVQLLATASEIHLKHKRGISQEAALDELRDTVEYARSLGVAHVSVGLEDASRGSRQLIEATIETSLAAGATSIVIADTTGCATPAEFGSLITAVRGWVPAPVTVSVHCHNDFGLALANALAGIAAGADGVQATVGGIGERAGNTALEEVVALLAYKSAELGAYTDVKTESLYEVYTDLRAAIGLVEPRNKAIVGTFAFATAAGIHQQGILQNPETYEYVRPARFGRKTTLLIARHSGRAILRHVLTEAGLDPADHDIDLLFERYVNGRAGGDCVELDVLRQEILGDLMGATA
ncbi:LeuA family protein [Micromonospora sp. NPDC050417]|uniref:LeuA family protein n=1 Tax=Micromonospora sp. NPDC050417 TaxID=3364280 RepID=UPI00378B55D7